TAFSDTYLNSILALEGRGPGKPTLSPKDSLEILFTNIIKSVIVDSIRITDTAGVQKTLNHTIVDQTLKLKGNWNRDSLLNVFIPPGTVTDIHGRSNDTIEFIFLTAPLEKYGDIIFTLKETEANLPYRIQLMRGGQIYEEKISEGSDSTTVTFVTLPAGDYEVNILEDRNGDGRWTPGRYIDKRLPEDQISLKLDPLRENWELQARYNWRKKAKE
ncbi:MAG: hypothetical protein HKN68_07350, partial [Saprospiraceae bacterium]|nr:hypothetical protein [Saprospiraceae bacterium]